MNSFFYIYVINIISAYIFGGLSQKNGKFNFFPFFISYLVPWFFICFSNNGPDYTTYKDIVEIMDWDNFSSSYISEPGFNLIIVCLKEISNNNVHITLFLLKTLNIILFSLSIFIVRDRINIRISNLFFVIFYFLPAYYLLSMYVAIGLILCSISLYIKYNIKLIPILLVLVAAQVHNSAYLMIPIFALVFSNYALKFANKPVVKYGLLIGAFVLISASTYIYSVSLSYFSEFSHYAGYIGEGNRGSGLYVYFMYIVQFIIVFEMKKNNSKADIPNILFLFTLFDFVFVLASYQFRVIDRMNFYFLSSFFIMYPILLYKKRFVVSQIAKFLLIFYAVVQAYYVYDSRTAALGMDSYHFFNPFI